MSNTETKRYFAHIAVQDVHGFPYNHRRRFEPFALKQLGDSIVKQGVIEPIIVVRATAVNGMQAGYDGIAGERRWRAARSAGIAEVPAIVYDGITRCQALELALVENLQRVDVNPIEEAEGLRALMDAAGMTQQQVAERIGRPRSSVANTLRLLDLPQFVQVWIRDGEMTRAHGVALLRWRSRPELLVLIANLAKIHNATATELETGVPLLKHWPDGYAWQYSKVALQFNDEKKQLIEQQMADGPFVESWLEAEYCYVCLDAKAQQHLEAEYAKVTASHKERADQVKAEIAARLDAAARADDEEEGADPECDPEVIDEDADACAYTETKAEPNAQPASAMVAASDEADIPDHVDKWLQDFIRCQEVFEGERYAEVVELAAAVLLPWINNSILPTVALRCAKDYDWRYLRNVEECLFTDSDPLDSNDIQWQPADVIRTELPLVDMFGFAVFLAASNIRQGPLPILNEYVTRVNQGEGVGHG